MDRIAEQNRVGRRWRGVIVALAMLMVALAQPAPVSAEWAPATDLAPGVQLRSSPRVAYDASGRAYSLFVQYQPFNERLMLAERPPGGPWGAPQQVPAGGNTVFYGMDLAVSAAGDVFVAFSNGNATVTRRPAGSTTWDPLVSWGLPGSAANTSSCLFSDPDIEAADNGDAVIAWSPYNACFGNVRRFRVLANEYRHGVGWAAAPQVWNVSGVEIHSEARVGIDADGSALVAFSARTATFPGNDDVYTVDLGPGGWASPALRSTISAYAAPAVAVRNGHAVLAWQNNGPGVATVRTGGVWEPVQFLPFAGGNGSSDRFVAITGDGTAYVAADRIVASNIGVHVASRQPGGGWTSVQVGAPNVAAMNPRIAANADGDVALVWDQSNSIPMAALKPADGSWPALGTPLTTVGGNNGSRPYVAVDRFGHALAGAGPVTNGLSVGALVMIETRDPAGESLADPPSVSPTAAAAGDTLTCSPGTFLGTPPFSYAFQWLQDGNPIPGATAATFVVRPDDAGLGISCRVTATNEAGVASADAADVVIDLTAPTNVVAPTITGTPEVGEALGCLPGTWTGGPTPLFEFEWRRNGAPIPFETADTYVLGVDDAATQIVCVVTAVNDAGTVSVAAAAVSVPAVAAPANLTPPTLSGPAQTVVKLGDQFTCLTGTWAGAPTPALTIEWLRSGVPIDGEVAATYVIAAADAGATITCQVTAENVIDVATATSTNSRTIPLPPVNNRLPSVGVASGTFAVGGTAQCNNGGWSRAQSFTYQWRRNSVPVVGATNQLYPITSADAGTALSCVVTALGRGGTSSATSPDRALAAAPTVVTPPTITGASIVNGTVRSNGRTIRCNRGTWTDATSFTYEWRRNGVGFLTGTTSYTTRATDVGSQITCLVTATGRGGSTAVETAPVTVVP